MNANSFAQRVAGALAGIPNSQIPDANLTFGVGGPVNHAPGYYPMDKKDFAPRLGIAFSPKGDSLFEKLMGKGSVLRTGAGIVYDNYGNAMAGDFAANGSPGLATVGSSSW